MPCAPQGVKGTDDDELLFHAFLVERKPMSESHNYTVPNVHSQLLFNRSASNLKISSPTKIFITQNSRNHSDLYPGMAVLGFEIGLPCYSTICGNLFQIYRWFQRIFQHVIYKFKVCKSVHHHTIQINQPTRCNNFSNLLLDVYLQLNMFRASSRPSSGAQQLQ
jgi:hypothetical protein